jgi:hypothetical protein
MKMTILKLSLISALWLAGCTNEPAVDNGAQSSAAENAPPSNRIDIPATVRNNLGITFAQVQRRNVADTIRIAGAFELQPLARHEYRMTLPGHVRLLVNQLDWVEPGTPLYRFRSPQWPELQHEIILAEQSISAAQADIEVARAKIQETRAQLAIIQERQRVLAQADFRRADLAAEAARLQAVGPRLKAELGRAETSLANAQMQREHAVHRASSASGIPEARLTAEVALDDRTLPAYRTIDWIDVKATESGLVETLAVTDGAFVEPPSVVVSTVDPERLRFRAMALQADLPRLVGTTEARIVPPKSSGIDIGDGVNATLTVGLEADPEHRTVALLATPQGTRKWIHPGGSAFLEVVVDSSGGPALAVPRSAIVKDGIVHVLFRRDPDDPNKAIRIEADMGVTDGRWVAIRSGLMLSDEVVLNGAYELKLASQQSGLDQKGGHFHADGTFHSGDSH